MPEPTRTANTVVLLHGLGRTSRSMHPMSRALERRGFRVLNVGYPSRTAPTEQLARGVSERIAETAPDGPLHFVTHSMGGILLRVATAIGVIPVERISRVVMLGPPNRGTELVDVLTARPSLATVYRRIVGPSGAELGTGGMLDHLPPVTFELGVVAGNRSVNPVFSTLIPRPNDGKVSVARTIVAGMRDMVVLPYPHPFLICAPATIEYTIQFLETGSFQEQRRPRATIADYKLAATMSGCGSTS